MSQSLLNKLIIALVDQCIFLWPLPPAAAPEFISFSVFFPEWKSSARVLRWYVNTITNQQVRDDRRRRTDGRTGNSDDKQKSDI